MAAIHWLNATSGSFSIPGDWSGGAVPGRYDAAVLDAAGSTPYTVTSSSSEVVGGVEIASNATLSITSGTFDILFGTGSVGNAGAIEVGSGATLVASGTVVGGFLDNPSSGVIHADAGAVASMSDVTLVGGTLETTGDGEVVFSGRSNSWNIPTTPAPLYNKGTSILADNSAVVVYGQVVNSGEISMQGDGDGCLFLVGSYDTVLEGGGSLVMGGTASNDDTVGATLDKATLTNVDNTISGSGQLGNLDMILVNRAAGVIDASGARTLFIETGSNTVVNDGAIEATGAGGIDIGSRLENDGVLLAEAGVLRLSRLVSGTGAFEIDGGTLAISSRFSQVITFVGAGTLDLGRSHVFSGSITGFSEGGSELELDDIRFLKRTKATFSGSVTGGVLTVTDGTHISHISLEGDYLSATFAASSDGQGGTDVVISSMGAPNRKPAHAFVSAMATFATSAGPPAHIGEAHFAFGPVLTCAHASSSMSQYR